MMHVRPRHAFLTALALAASLLGMVGLMQTGNLEASRQLPLFSANSTASAFTSVTNTRTATAPTSMIALGDSIKRFRGVEVTFFGVGADNSTFDYRVYVVKRSTSVTTAGASDDYDRLLICHGTATLSASVGVSRQWITSSNRIADTLTVVTDPYGVAMCAAYGGQTPTVYSPGGDLEARLFVPECGNGEFLWIETSVGTATSANALIERGI